VVGSMLVIPGYLHITHTYCIEMKICGSGEHPRTGGWGRVRVLGLADTMIFSLWTYTAILSFVVICYPS